MRLFPSLCLLLLGCDALLTSNPKNCVENSRACSPEQVCNPDTQGCEARNCRSSPLDCLVDQYCDPTSKLCVEQNCVTSPSQCAIDQRCNAANNHCETIPFVLGQPDQQTNLNSSLGMNAPQGVLLVPDPASPGQSKLLVADKGNRRVLIWNRVPTQNRAADTVLGMPDVHTLSPADAYAGINEASFLAPSAISAFGGKLAVADTGAHRILFWNQIPSAPATKGPIPANSLWGQTTFRTSQSDSPSGQTNRLGVFGPGLSFAAASGRFFVSDQFNHRVLPFFLAPTGPMASPILALGQVDFVSASPGLSATAMNQPRAVTSGGSELFVADTQNNRVLVYDLSGSFTTTPTTSAVLGQPTFIDGKANLGGSTPSASTLNQPLALHLIDGPPRLLWVADASNHRVLRYTLPTPAVTNPAADLVLGQTDFAGRAVGVGAAVTASSLNSPSGVHSDGTRLVVSDTGAHRVLIWNSLPTANQQAADVVLGQASATSFLPNNVLPPQPLRFNQVAHVATDGTRLFVVDQGNSRVLIWNQVPKQAAVPPDLVLGQLDFTSGLANRGGGASSATLSTPTAVAISGGRLAVADSGNNRVLIWNSIPTQSGAPASACLGQASCAVRMSETTQGRMNSPSGVSIAGGRIFVADAGNHRVLSFAETAPTGSLADGLLGQPTFTGKTANPGGQSAATLSAPRQVQATATQILVADSGNHRVLIWNSWPSALGAPADVVIGQDDFTSSYPRATRSRLENPTDLLLWRGALYVASVDQHRVLIWSTLPTQNGQPADLVLGQPDFASALPNHPDQPLADRLTGPVGLAAVGNQLFIAEQTNNRVSVHRQLP
jgi:hypothetical protein